jgi:phospholipase/carboxylesterase
MIRHAFRALTGAAALLTFTAAGFADNTVPKKSAVSTAAEISSPVTANAAQSAVSKIVPETQSSILRNKLFVHHVYKPENASDQTIILMHGSGGNEQSLVSLASKIAPRATLIGIRGRVTQDGKNRWYKRITPISFDQQDIREEADAFAAFVSDFATQQKIDLDRTIFLGYSNGANLLSSLSLLHPEIVHRAVLLRPMTVLNQIPAVSLKNSNFLTIAGRTDKLYAPFAPALEDTLRKRGANVEAHMIPSNHGLGAEDVKIVAEWIASTGQVASQTR